LTAVHWPGVWLWPARDRAVGATLFHEPPQPSDPDRNAFVRFRGRLEIASLPSRATLWLSADGRYLAYVNGHRLGRGPAASDADVREVDPYEIASLLVPGPNVVAVLVHAYGVDTAWYTRPTALAHSGRGGGALYAHVNLDGQIGLTASSAWRCLRGNDWSRDTPRVNDALGFIEVRDVRLEPPGWESAAFDDASWAIPEPCAPDAPALPGRTYFPVLRPRAVAVFRERGFPSVTWVAHEVSDADRPAPPDILARARAAYPSSLDRCTVDGGPGQTVQPLCVRTVAGSAVRLWFDFGRLVAGRPRLEIDGASGVVIDLATAERVDDAGLPIVDLFGSRHGHRFVLRSGPQSLEQWDWIGFRHLFVWVRGAAAGIVIRSVTAVASEDPTHRFGEFACSDDVLTGVWAAGAHTVSLVTTDLIHGDVAREQRQWVGDMQPALGAILFALGGTTVARHGLQLVAEAEPFAGFLPMYAPGDYRAVGTTIPDFTLRWVLALDEYDRWSGDTAFVADVYPALLRSIRAFGRFVDEMGMVAVVPYWHFIDWAAVGRDGPAGPINGLYVLALDAASRLAIVVGDTRQAARLRRAGADARSAMRARLKMRDGLFGDTPAGPLSQHTNALALLAGVAPPTARARIATAIGERSRLRITEAGRIVSREDAAADYDPLRHIVAAQPGFMGFVVRALEVARRPDLALELIRDWWGPMAPSGTCWETWSGRHSRCHPWATAPTAELPRIVLGVNAIERGWSKVHIDPFVGDLTWARGCVPTPHGDMRVSWSRDEAGIALDLNVPDGVVVELRGGELLGAGSHQRRGPARGHEADSTPSKASQ
jgi:alpha-L-rhamnosidase